MADLRWWADEVGKPSVVVRDNHRYHGGVRKRQVQPEVRKTQREADRERQAARARRGEVYFARGRKTGWVKVGRTSTAADRPELRAAGGEGTVCVLGRAGAGKTRALRPLREALEASGVEVVGASVQNTAARILEEEAGIRSTSLTQLLYEADVQGFGLPRGGVVVIDEAAMAPTRSLARLQALAERDGTRLVLIGDPEQLPAIEPPGAFRALVDRLGAVELAEVRRLRDPGRTRGGGAGAVGAGLGGPRRVLGARPPHHRRDDLGVGVAERARARALATTRTARPGRAPGHRAERGGEEAIIRGSVVA